MKKSIYIVLLFSIFFIFNANAQKLEVSEFEINKKDSNSTITIDKNGVIKINNEKVGKVHTNGFLKDNNGNLIAKITNENVLQDKNGKNLVKIDENGKIDNGSGIFIDWSKDGEFMKGSQNTDIFVTPNNKKLYQTASVVLYLFLTSDSR